MYFGGENNIMNQKTMAVYSRSNQQQLASKALELAKTDKSELSVVSVFPECGGEYAEKTEQLYQYSSSIGAEMTVLYSSEPALALMKHVKHNKITNVVISESDTSGVAKLIQEVLPKVKVTVVPNESSNVCSWFAADLFCCAISGVKQ